jgi:hypothetical protein
MFQSAYRPFHSVETALLHVTSSILEQLDTGRNVYLVLLDLSAAFDTVDHKLLIAILRQKFNIAGTALSWIKSYLSGRTFRVKINGVLSEPRVVKQGVPQGSVLGPLLFNILMSQLATILDSIHGVGFHMYADDTQFWVSFDAKNPAAEISARKTISEVFAVIKTFMQSHSLKLNGNKTVFMPFSRVASSFQPVSLESGLDILPSSSCRNLGVVLDTKLSLGKYITELRQSCFYHLKRLASVKTSIPKYVMPSFVHAFITSRIDFCNSIFSGLPISSIQKIQVLHSCCAKFLTGRRKFDSSTKALSFLHWLPVNSRITFKLCLFAHRMVYSQSCPLYFSKDLNTLSHGYNTRSTNAPILKSTFYPRCKFFGDRSFLVSIPTAWNTLPQSIRSIVDFIYFKRALKTHLFN